MWYKYSTGTAYMAKDDIVKHQYKKGQSGNPSGRPKGALNSRTILRKFLELTEEVENPVTGIKEDMSQLEILYLKQIAKARKGDLPALKEILDRYEGKPIQTVEQNIKVDPVEQILEGFGLDVRKAQGNTEESPQDNS